MKHFTSVEDYVNSFEDLTRQRLEEMRKLVKRELPDAEERISYNIPAYFLEGRPIIYVAGYKQHVGIYPGRTDSRAFNELAGRYAHGKSTLRFPHAEPLPTDLIRKFIKIRLQEDR